MLASRVPVVVCSVIAALFLSSTTSAAQSKQPLVVRVTDASNAPVPGAILTVSARDARVPISQTTDTSGEVRFMPLLAGPYVLEVNAAGFVRVIRSISVGPGPSIVAVSVTLAGITERVVVTASGRLQTGAETSKAVTVVDEHEIDARNEFSVAAALRSVPGAQIQQLGGPGAFTSIKLRGLREQDTAVLIDGVRFRDSASPQGDATAFIGELYIANLDRIEVLRGSGSSLYGSHAVGGVVNLITRSGSGQTSGEAAVEAGGLGFSRARGHLAGGAWSDRLSYSIATAHASTSRGVDGDDTARNTTVESRGDVKVFGSGRATVSAYVSDSTSAINDSPGALGPLPSTGFVKAVPWSSFTPAPNDPDSVRHSEFLSAHARLEQRPSTRFGYTASIHHLTTDRIFLDGPLGSSGFEPAGTSQSQFKGQIDTVDLRADREWNTGHLTTIGYELERERYESQATPVNPLLVWRADITQTSHSLYVRQEARLNALQLAASMRAQRFSLDRAAFEPPDRAPFTGVSFTAPPSALTADVAASRWLERTGTKIRAHAGNAYRAPAMFERAGTSFGSRGYTTYGDPRLAPERSVAVDAGIDQQFVGNRAELSATWFHTRLRKVIAFGSLDRTTDPLGRTSGYRSADGRMARGIELNMRARPYLSFEAAIAYTLVDAPAPTGDRDGLPRAPAVAAHQFSVVAIQRLGRLQLSFELEAASDHYVTLFDPVSFGSRAYQFDGLVKADLVAVYTLPGARARLRLFGMFDNLFNRRYFVQGFRTPRRTARGGLVVTF